MTIILVLLFYGLLFGIFELTINKYKVSKELSRKLIHIISGIFAAFLPYIITFHQIIILSIVFTIFMFISKRFKILSAIHEVQRKTYGEVYFPLTVLITALLFPNKLLFTYGLLILAISDGFATIIGQKYGNKIYKITSANKSYIGSLTFFICSFFLGIILVLLNGNDFSTSFTISFILSIILTLVEGGLSYGLDNLILPPLASCLMLIFIQL